jgi:hypothetical protein
MIKTLYEYLREGYTVAQLATAIEINGVHGWDRFGRYEQFSPKAAASQYALDGLAQYSIEEQRFYDNRDAEDAEGLDGHDLSSFDAAENFPYLAIHRLGWSPKNLPNIDQTIQYPSPPKAVRADVVPKNLMRIIGALLAESAVRTRSRSQSQLIDDLCAKHPEVPGFSKSNLEKRFAEANRSLSEAKK